MTTQNLFLDDCPIRLTVETDQITNYLILDLGEKGENPNKALTGHTLAIRREGEGWHLAIMDYAGEEVAATKLPALDLIETP